MIFILSEIFILCIIMGLLLLLSWIWPPDSPWAPWWKTTREVSPAIKRLAKIKRTDTVYELGSGDGENLLFLAKTYGIRCVGVELDPWRVFQSRFLVNRQHLQGKVEIVKGNLFDVSIAEATVVYLYLVPKTLEKLKRKLLTELKPGTRIVSYRYKISYLAQKGFNVQHMLYLYQIPWAIKKKKKS